jgi:hypothetical protein
MVYVALGTRMMLGLLSMIGKSSITIRSSRQCTRMMMIRTDRDMEIEIIDDESCEYRSSLESEVLDLQDGVAGVGK